MNTVVYSVPKGNLTGNRDNLFLGHLLKHVYIGCVDNDAFNGSYYKMCMDSTCLENHCNPTLKENNTLKVIRPFSPHSTNLAKIKEITSVAMIMLLDTLSLPLM